MRIKGDLLGQFGELIEEFLGSFAKHSVEIEGGSIEEAVGMELGAFLGPLKALSEVDPIEGGVDEFKTDFDEYDLIETEKKDDVKGDAALAHVVKACGLFLQKLQA